MYYMTLLAVLSLSHYFPLQRKHVIEGIKTALIIMVRFMQANHVHLLFLERGERTTSLMLYK